MKPRLAFEVLTLFPEAVEGFARAGLLGKAVDKGIVALHCTNFRDFTTDKHRTVDDVPFGGGAGMVMKPGPVVAALESVVAARGPVHTVLLTPSAPRFDQAAGHRLAAHDRIALLCGRYEGIDDRVREHFVDECLSIGDFVLGGGEVAALTIIEAVARLVPGVVGNPESVQTESFAADPSGALLEHPQYTRPAEFRGHRVPEVLLGGNHGAIAAWRQEAARQRTWALRPDLRRTVPIAEDTPIHLAVSAGVAPDAALLEVARRHGVAGIALLGRDAALAMPWVAASRGRPPVASFASLEQLDKRLRRASGTAPWVVVGRDAGDTHAGAIDDRGRLLDRLDGANAPAGRTLILWLPGPSAVATLDPARDRVDAVYAPILVDDPTPAPPGTPLETGVRIADSSRPPTSPAALADRILSDLRQRGPES